MIHILHHQTDELVGWISQVHYDSHQNSLDNKETYDFKTSIFEPGADKISKRSRIIIPSEEGDYREFIVDETVELTSQETIEVYSTGSFMDLAKLKVIPAQTRDGETVLSAATYALDGLPWKVGITEYSGIYKWTIENYTSALGALKQIATLFNCELRFRVTVEGDKVTGRYVDLLKRQGMDRGNEIVFGKDLVDIKRKVNTERVVTALYCISPEREDGTRLTTTVYDEKAFQNWNWHGEDLIEVYEPESENQDMTLEQLTSYGKKELNKRIAAAVEYEVDAVALDQMSGYDHEVRRLGDTTRIKDEHFKPPMYLDSRVIFVERSVFDKSRKSYKLGEVIEYKEEDIFKEFRKMQSAYAFKMVRSPNPPPGKPNVMWVQTGKPVDVAHTWNSDIQDWEKHTPTQAVEVNSYSQTDIDTKDTDAYQGATVYTDQRFTNDEVLSSVEVSPNGNILPKNGKRITTQRLAADDSPLEGDYLDVEGGRLVSYKSGSSRTLVSMKDTIPKIMDGNKRYGRLEPEAYGKMFCYEKEFLIPSASHQLGDVYSYTVTIPDYTLVGIGDILSIQLTSESARFSINVKQNSYVSDGTDLMSFDVELTPKVAISGPFTIPVYIMIIGTR